MRFSYSSGSRPLQGYTIKRGIGVGGFGEVYFALNDAGKEVALKKIQRNLDIELRGVGYCLNLKHVNLIALWDIQSNEFGESWVVMEYVPGPSLRDEVEANRQGMPVDQVKRWFSSTAAGVAYLHEHGIVHRDLKPGNIFCDQDEQVVKIGDYGLSKFISCSNRSGQTEAVGTFHYMAPEIGKGEYGKEIDIYAMGIILYEMLTGDVPFDGESTQEIIMKHLTMDPDLSGLDESYHRVVGKALRKDPKKRYSSIGEMVRDLPWPEIASAGEAIINRHAVGPIRFPAANLHKPKSTAGYKKEAELAATENEQPLTPTRAKAQLPQAILKGGFASGSVQPEALASHGAAAGANQGTASRQAVAASQVVPPGEEVTAEYLTVGDGEEPMAFALRSGLRDLNDWWNQANVSTPVRLGLMVVAGIVVVQNSTWLLAVFVAMAVIYLLYYSARRYVLSPVSEDVDQKLATASEMKKKYSYAYAKLTIRPATDQLTELVGSLLIGGISVFVFNFFALASGIETGAASVAGTHGSTEGWAIFTWQTFLCLVAVWAVLAITKQWTWKPGDIWSRLGTMCGAGAAIGAIAFYTATSFQIDLARITAEDFAVKQTESLVVGGFAKLPSLVLFGAALFVFFQFGRHTDPLRRTRLSIMNVFLCFIVAAIGSHLLNLPLTVVCSFAVVVSISLQLASPWVHPERIDGLSNSTIG
jgi:serine/threonine protein kinase